MRKTTRLLLDTWSDNIGLDIEKQIKKWGNDINKVKSDAPTPYEFKSKEK